MNVSLHRILGCLLFLYLNAGLFAAEPQLDGQASAPSEPLSLWYRQPAAKWTEALAVGNGRLGAMVFGGISRERLQLNEDTLWAGGPYDPVNPQAREALPEVRKLVFEGKYREAARMISARVMSKPLGPDAVSNGGRIDPDLSRADVGGELPPRSQPGHRRCHGRIHGPRHEVHPPGILQSNRSSHRRPAHGRQERRCQLHRRAANTAKSGHRN